jgi:hypothetical protein
MRVNAVAFRLHMDNINLFAVVKYMDESEIVKKVMGFVEKYADEEVQAHEVPAKKGENTYVACYIDFLLFNQ